ncbi:MAG: outer membrane beta-barrel protein [Alphaproteobacteria bacterium]|nr:outer membrane beta-barrel protein [Alphaproteobacteria bacterium]
MMGSIGRAAFAARVGVVCALLGAPSVAFAEPEQWTGFYIGAVGGYANDTMDIAGPPYPAGAPTQNMEGGLLGATVGFNWQAGSMLVLGVEADLSATHMEDTVRDGNYLLEGGEITSFGTLRARVGLSFGKWLPFVTAGYMWDDVEQSFSCPDSAGVPFGFCRPVASGGHGVAGGFTLKSSETQSGFIWGGGVEYSIDGNWSVKAEDFVGNFDDQNYNLGPDGAGVDKLLTTKQSLDNLFRFGVNYRF